MSKGHRAVPHTADIAVEAWADNREECLAEAVQALVESFADSGGAVPDDCVTLAMAEETDEALLVAVLDEVIYQIEVYGRLAVDVSIDERTGATKGQVEVRLATVPVETADQVGAMPKAIAVHSLRFGRECGLWRAHVLVDV
ncbi:archease [Nonomuraea africana]|uniref:SHS2 domain-containing protein n=1 Tax=Nonomuraea africana TaxID=46171 RepID=A0ABR9KB70_9ACTN|nr:archease [Nonomuraea africana]MBE1559252.1 SHS2 domain-containing protein [Nonomuraea africana]